MDLLLEGVIEFFKEHGAMISRRETYTEAAYHLMFMA